MSVTKEKNDQFAALTSLRFLAALLVFVFHFQPRSGGLEVVIGQGHVGVGIFFVLSGFLITLRYFPDQARGEFRIGEYFLRRAARILPLYYTVFILSLYLANGGLSFADRLPEWTLTQALFGESLHLFAIPTSWSLTVEECFYALAPLVFLAIAAAQRRAPRRPLLAAGGVLGRPGPGLLATGGATALIVAAQWGMREAGGIDGPRWAQAWGWDLLLAPAAAALIVSLTSEGNPVARALGVRPLVYLGKVSYALYLVQLTPIGKGLFYRVLPRNDDAALVALYVGVTAVSAILYELVEEPARRLILRWAGRERAAPRA